MEPTVAIIGYGTAGVNAIIALRNAGYEGAIRVFSTTDMLPYSPILTSYYAGGRKTFEECLPWSAEEMEQLGAQVLCNCPVLELDCAEHLVRTAQGDFPYTKCLIATGATPQTFGFPGVEGEPDYKPFVLRTMEDAERLRTALENPANKRFLVSGASMVALKMLEAFLDRGKQAALVGMLPHVLDNNALPEAAERFERGLREKGVELHLGQTISHVQRIAPEDGAADVGPLEVTFSTGETGVFDCIAVAHGMRSNMEFVKEGQLEIDRALVVDEFMRTSDPDVYAAGDVAQGLELISGAKQIVGIWKNAAVQGACAGWAMAAEMAGRAPSSDHAFKGAIATNTIAVNGTLFISAGVMNVTENRRVDVRETDEMTVVRIFQSEDDGTERLVGFNLASDIDEEGGAAYDIGAMLTLRIEEGCRR